MIHQHRNSDRLHQAVENRDVSELQRLIEAGDVDIHVNRRLLCHAVAIEALDIVRCVLEIGALDFDNWHALHPMLVVADKGNVAIARLLLQHGVNINTLYRDVTCTPNAQYTVLHFACCSASRLEFARFLVEAGADVNASDGQGETPLFCAVRRGLIHTVTYLVSVPGCTVDARDRRGRSPLMMWRGGDDDGVDTTAMARKLIAAGANVDAVDRNGDNVVFFHRYSPPTLRLLLACGANVCPRGIAAVGYFDIDTLRGRDESKFLLCAAGALREQCCLEPSSSYTLEIGEARRAIAKERIDLVRQKAAMICIGIHNAQSRPSHGCNSRLRL